MPHHHNTALSRTVVLRRSCARRTYARLYLVVGAADKIALCETQPYVLLAFTDWTEAVKASVPFRGFVTNWEEFQRRGYLENFGEAPPVAMRILHTDHKGKARRYHAEFDATPEELRTLNQITPYDLKKAPLIAQRKRAKAKVWEETL